MCEDVLKACLCFLQKIRANKCRVFALCSFMFCTTIWLHGRAAYNQFVIYSMVGANKSRTVTHSNAEPPASVNHWFTVSSESKERAKSAMTSYDQKSTMQNIQFKQEYALTPPDQTLADIAVIIPFRDRQEHLEKLLSAFQPFLAVQNISYQVFVIEQVENQTFNKGKMMNVGFKFAKHWGNFTCYVFHDVDMIPIVETNIYQCGPDPRHFAVGYRVYNQTIWSAQIAGGAVAFTTEQFLKVNGYSGNFWGWGGEDDDIFFRIKAAGFHLWRPSADVGLYKMIEHPRDKENPPNTCRYAVLKWSSENWQIDGLNTVMYKLESVKKNKRYISLLVDALPELTYRNFC